MNAFLKFSILCISFLSLTTLAEEENINSTPTTPPNYESNWDVSGYVKIFADIPTNNTKSTLYLDDLSVYVSGNINQWFNPFVEAEYFGNKLWSSQKGEGFKKGKFIFERLYNDFNLNTHDRIRVGKFLAPVGYWNLIHAAPLVWTVHRPLTSTYSYSNYISGLEYGHSLNLIEGSRIDFYAQLSNDLNPKPLSDHPRRYSKVIGASWTLSDQLDTRSSLDFQYAKVKTTQNNRLTVSFQKIWYMQTWDIDTQVIYTKITNTSAEDNFDGTIDNETLANEEVLRENGWDGGGYLQARYRFSPQWNFYGRGEYFHLAIEQQSGQSYILGARYRLGKWGNINLEFKQGNGAKQISDSGFSLSYNAMFR